MNIKREYALHKFASTRQKKRKKPLDRLTRDAIAADHAGQSYGKWKANHPQTGDVDDDSMEVAEGVKVLICMQCGKEFLANNKQSNKRYCSEECRYEAAMERDKERNPDKYLPHPCPVCGKMVSAYRGRKYCSVACKEEGNRQSQKERNQRKKEEKENGGN